MPLPGTKLQGSLHSLDRHLAAGWAFDPSRPDEALTVSVFLDGRLLFETAANIQRIDLAEAGIGKDGSHAFFHAFPEPLTEEQLTRLIAVAGDQPLPITLEGSASPSDPFIVGSIERLDQDGVAGWVYNSAVPTHAVTVSIFCGDRPLGSVEADLLREDLQSAGIGTGKHGFRYAFPEALSEEDVSQVIVRVGNIPLPRAEKLEAFRPALLPASAETSIQSRAVVFPILLRPTFEISSDSVIGRLMRLESRAFAPTRDRIYSLMGDLVDVVRTGCPDKLHLETLTVSMGAAARQVKVSRTNSNFTSADRKIDEFRYGNEPEILACIDLLVPYNGVMLDIGSNWGYFAIALAARANFAGCAYAFEPGGQSFEDMTKIVRDLGLEDRLACKRLALGDYSGSARLSVGLISGLSSLVNTVAQNYASGYEEVEIARLDDLNLPDAHLIKIDVEGFEAQVIRGSEQYIRKAKPAIIFENWKFADDADKGSEPLRILSSWGYELFLPCWTDSARRVLSSFPLGQAPQQLFALCRFDVEERPFLDERINILALPSGAIGRMQDASPPTA